MAISQEEVRRADRVAIAAAPVVSVPIEVARVSWGGVWSGVLVGFGIVLLLGALGVAVATTVVGPRGAAAWAFGANAAVWGLASALVALFLGGVAASRMGGVVGRGAGAMHGMLVWVLATIFPIVVAAAALGTHGVFGGTTVQTMAEDFSSVAAGDADQISARLADPRTVDLLVAVTGIPPAEARAALAGVNERVQAARNDPARARAEARAGLHDIAARAHPYARTTGWSLFGGLVVSWLIALLGGMAGGRPVVVRARL